MKALRLASVPLATVLVTFSAAVQAPAPASAATVSRAALDVPSYASPTNLAQAADPAQSIDLSIWLGLRNQAAAQVTAAAVTAPGSLGYRHYLSTQQVMDDYAPAAGDVAAAESWAASHGLRVVGVGAFNAYVTVSGSVAQLESLFETTIGLYRVRGGLLRAPETVPQYPADLPADVIAVQGLDQHEALYTPAVSTYTPPAAFANGPPCQYNSSWVMNTTNDYYNGQIVDTTDPEWNGGHPNYTICGQTPQSLQQIYGLTSAENGGVNGHGYTVGIVDSWDSPDMESDANTWSTNRGIPQFGQNGAGSYTDDSPPGLSQTPEDPTGVVDPASWAAEQALDVETIHGVAPGANIIFVGAVASEDPSFEGAELTAIADGANEVSNSYGGSGDGDSADQEMWNEILTVANMKGVGIYVSAGDSTGVEFPSALPGVTAVGGTSVELAQNGSIALETGWQTGKATISAGAWTTPAYDYGTGGGITTYAMPSYQEGVVPASLSTTDRVVPDVSADADPSTGYIIGLTQAFDNGSDQYGEFREGGTSLACPLIAAIIAVASQEQGAAVGFANPALYKLYGTSALRDVQPLPSGMTNYGEVRNDFTNGGTDGPYAASLRTFNFNVTAAGQSTTVGYDDNTGIGTPNGTAFLTFNAAPAAQTAEAPLSVLFVAAGGVAAATVAVRRRRRIRVAGTA